MATTEDMAGVTDFTVVEGRSAGFYALVTALALVVAAGLWAAHVMDTEGHHVTGVRVAEDRQGGGALDASLGEQIQAVLHYAADLARDRVVALPTAAV